MSSHYSTYGIFSIWDLFPSNPHLFWSFVPDWDMPWTWKCSLGAYWNITLLHDVLIFHPPPVITFILLHGSEKDQAQNSPRNNVAP